MSTDTLMRTARVARRMPGYLRLRRSLVPRLRRNQALRRAAQTIWPVPKKDRRREVVDSDVSTGRLLQGLGTQHLPRLGVVALGCEEAVLAGVVSQVAQEQLLSASFGPVFVLDQPHFALTRRYGFVTELLPPALMSDPQALPEFLAERLTCIQRAYGVREWLRVGPDGLDDVDRTLLRLPR